MEREIKNGAEAKSILFVEDEPLLGELIVDALSEKGFAVTVVPDAGGALRYLLSGARADVLFTDIDLGSGMDGAELAQLVHAMRPKLSILYASGRTGPGEFKSVPGSEFLPKPYSLQQVDQALARLTGASLASGARLPARA
jgi:CheY-like chemotaxis protein